MTTVGLVEAQERLTCARSIDTRIWNIPKPMEQNIPENCHLFFTPLPLPIHSPRNWRQLLFLPFPTPGVGKRFKGEKRSLCYFMWEKEGNYHLLCAYFMPGTLLAFHHRLLTSPSRQLHRTDRHCLTHSTDMETEGVKVLFEVSC